jgi:nucleoid-associated protein YgaU
MTGKRERVMKKWLQIVVASMAVTTLVALALDSIVAKGDIPTKTITYTTHRGDTLWSIAAHFDPDSNTQEVINEIEQTNRLNDNDFLQLDKQLIVPVRR